MLDLISEALQRMGQSYRPKEKAPARESLDSAPTHIRELVRKLEPIAVPAKHVETPGISKNSRHIVEETETIVDTDDTKNRTHETQKIRHKAEETGTQQMQIREDLQRYAFKAAYVEIINKKKLEVEVILNTKN